MDGRERTYTRSRGCKEDECSQVRGALVAKCTGSIDKCSNTVGLHSASNEGAAPSCGGTGSLLRLDELLLRVGSLGAVVGVTKDRGQDAQGSCVGEDCTQRDGGGLHGGEV